MHHPNPEPDHAAMREGARNLLANCVELKAGDHLLIVREPEDYEYYDQAAPACVEREARAMGARVHSIHTPGVDGPDDAPAFLTAALEHVDHTLFFSRIGDQMRFYPLPGACKPCVMRWMRGCWRVRPAVCPTVSRWRRSSSSSQS